MRAILVVALAGMVPFPLFPRVDAFLRSSAVPFPKKLGVTHEDLRQRVDSRRLRGTRELLHEADVRRACRVPARAPDARARRADQNWPVEVARRAGLHRP